MGATLDGVIEKITDGDTVRVTAAGQLWKVRVLSLDTEESNAGGSKPVTPWGIAASDFVKSILPVGAPVTIEFPGDAPALVGGEPNVDYLDNFGRPLGFIRMQNAFDGFHDLSELLIRRGFSPYFVKYGRAVFAEKDQAYAAVERAAQMEHLGVWNQPLVNNAPRPEDAPRNYPRLMVWWELRARIIDGFRAARAAGAPNLFNTRLDYSALLSKAQAGEEATVFMELTRGQTAGGAHHVIRTGSTSQPFQLFMPDEDRDQIVEIKNLLRNRYIADGEDYPRRNYAYVTGRLQMFGTRPEMIVETVDQISDTPPGL